MIKKLLIANRGEIAVRIIRAAKDLGIQSVAVYSEADADALHMQMADEAILIGPPQVGKSYLDQQAILNATRETNADAIHPGYGFLAENAAFAAACKDAGFIFVGPSSEAIARMGDKALARQTAADNGVPTVPGSQAPIHDVKDAKAIAEQVGYPVMIKAAAGGGGRGIRIASNTVELEQQLPIAQQEATVAFGDGSVYLERFINNARHIEVQVIGDGTRAVHLFERECSMQRRRQKVIEEAPSTCLTPKLRQQMMEAAVRLTEAVQYRGAGTLEFLVNPQTDEFFFIEMNTRIQVEHPITEMITGIDIVQEQLMIASGELLQLSQEEITIHGWSIECRINAENPTMNFMPSPGQIQTLHIPSGPWVRFDTAIYEGYAIPPFYDSLIGKLVVWGNTRVEAIQRSKRALSELHVEGIHTTRDLLLALMDDVQFLDGEYHTNYLETWIENQYSKEVIYD